MTHAHAPPAETGRLGHPRARNACSAGPWCANGFRSAARQPGGSKSAASFPARWFSRPAASAGGKAKLTHGRPADRPVRRLRAMIDHSNALGPPAPPDSSHRLVRPRRRAPPRPAGPASAPAPAPRLDEQTACPNRRPSSSDADAAGGGWRMLSRPVQGHRGVWHVTPFRRRRCTSDVNPSRFTSQKRTENGSNWTSEP